MSDGRFHRKVGTVVGVGAAAYCARQQPLGHAIVEAIGGGLAGNLGARLPDFIDPPTSPRHRSIGHGMVPCGAAGHAAMSSFAGLQTKLRAEAARRAELQRTTTSTAEQLWHLLLELLCRLGAGAIPGFVAGYGSHVALDFCTPASLPLIA